MTDKRSELLPCPNPWCDRGDPCLRRSRERKHRTIWVQVFCTRCEMAGPRGLGDAAAIAAWNTRKDEIDLGNEGWVDAAHPAPEGQPVIALYRAFDRPGGKAMKHVVWWREGGWRIYPFTNNTGFVDRWRPLATG
jgi:hypothetical protein